MIKAWSYSRLTTYEQCPLKAKLKFVDRLPEPPNKAMERGSKIHEEAASYLSKETNRLPASLKKLERDYRALRTADPAVELQIAFDRTWKLVEWFSPQAWLRVVVDALSMRDGDALVVDHKTGKVRDGYESQLDLYATAIFAAYPEVQTVTPQLWFVDHGVKVPRLRQAVTFVRDKLTTHKKEWTKRALPMLSDKRFVARPNWSCQWCHFRKDNGGPCKF